MEYNPASVMINRDLASDLLSNLPIEIIQKILVLLPIREAIKTSILSRKWRYRWAYLPSLVFDDMYFAEPNKNTVHSLTKLVIQVLLRHKGPIQKFMLVIPYDPNVLCLEQLLPLLSRKDIRELSLIFGSSSWRPLPPMPRVSSCLFFCWSLTHLELHYCVLNPPPMFKGFPFLKSLYLANVGPRRGIEDIIFLSPLLEEFSWFDNTKSDMRIHAPNLKRLSLLGSLGDVSLDYSPLLLKFRVGMIDEVAESSSARKLAMFLGDLFYIEYLKGDFNFTEILSDALEDIHAPFVYPNLRCIRLDRVSFKNVKEICAVLCLMMSSPRLSGIRIDIKCSAETIPEAADACSWDTTCISGFTFQWLEVVDFTGFIGLPYQMRFVEFILGNSPALLTLSIKTCQHHEEGEVSMLKELLSFCRASPSAKVLFLQP